MMLPLRCSIMWGAAALMVQNVPLRWVRTTASKSSSGMSHTMLTRVFPALLTRQSMRPKESMAVPMMFRAPSMVATVS